LPLYDHPSTILPTIIRYLGKANGDWLQASKLAEHDDIDRRAQTIIKNAVPGMGMDSSSLATINAVGAYIESLSTVSAIAAIPFVAPPLNTNIAVSTLNATATLVAGGVATPVSTLSVANKAILRIKIVALLVMTQELLRFEGAGAESLVNAEVRKGVGIVLDKEVLSRLVDGSTPIVISSGVDPLKDLRALLHNIIGATGGVNPYYVMDVLTAIDLSLYVESTGALLFPNMTPRGGTIAGVPTLVSSAISDRRIYALDSSSIAVNVTDIALDTSTQAAIEMSDSPTTNSIQPVQSTAVSLFQTNSSAIRCVMTLGVERLRNAAVAVVENAEYAQVST
jgi:hypothetical protein